MLDSKFIQINTNIGPYLVEKDKIVTTQYSRESRLLTIQIQVLNSLVTQSMYLALEDTYETEVLPELANIEKTTLWSKLIPPSIKSDLERSFFSNDFPDNLIRFLKKAF